MQCGKQLCYVMQCGKQLCYAMWQTIVGKQLCYAMWQTIVLLCNVVPMHTLL
jgi:hypothetical protein